MITENEGIDLNRYFARKRDEVILRNKYSRKTIKQYFVGLYCIANFILFLIDTKIIEESSI